MYVLKMINSIPTATMTRRAIPHGLPPPPMATAGTAAEVADVVLGPLAVTIFGGATGRITCASC